MNTTHLGYGSGYTQSQLVSNDIVGHCAEHALFHDKRLHTIKPGYIIGSLTAGVAKQTDFIWRLIAECIEIEVYNDDERAKWLSIANLDTVAEQVVSGLCDSGQHCNNREPVLFGLLFSDLWALLIDRFGDKLKPLPHDA